VTKKIFTLILFATAFLSFITLATSCGSMFEDFKRDMDSIPIFIFLIPRDGLIAEYIFNGNANDTSGNGNNGIVNGATITTDRFGNTGKAYSFDGVGDNILFYIANDAVFLSSSTTYSISLWFNASSSGGYIDIGAGRGCIYLRDMVAGFSYDRSIKFSDNDNGKLAIRDNPTFGGTANIETTNTIISFDVWYHTVLVIEDTSAKVYLNNTLESTVSVLSNPLYLFHIGSAQRFWSGTVDDVRIYNRALSAVEVMMLYNEGGWTGN